MTLSKAESGELRCGQSRTWCHVPGTYRSQRVRSSTPSTECFGQSRRHAEANALPCALRAGGRGLNCCHWCAAKHGTHVTIRKNLKKRTL